MLIGSRLWVTATVEEIRWKQTRFVSALTITNLRVPWVMVEQPISSSRGYETAKKSALILDAHAVENRGESQK
jgi:hypothetical protein